MHPISRVLTHASFALALAAAGPVPARAEGGIPVGEIALAAVQVDLAASRVAEVSVPPGARLVFANPGPETARVELALPRGEGIACASPGETPAKGRKFVVSGGATLACDAPAESTAYRVFRGPGTTAAENGRIEVTSVPRP
jgi:hypothetical protein